MLVPACCRKLTWIYSLGMCVLRGNFDAKPIEMQMGTLQAALCVLLNDTDTLTYAEVRTVLCAVAGVGGGVWIIESKPSGKNRYRTCVKG